MIQEMRELALDFVIKQMGHRKGEREALFRQWRQEEPEQLFPFLLEGRGKIDTAFVLEADPHSSDVARLIPIDVSDENQYHFPFVKPSGSQSPQVGPVLKRSWDPQKGAGPKTKILRSTFATFQEEATKDISSSPHAAYFREVVSLLERESLVWGDTRHSRKELGAESLLEVAIQAPGSSVPKPTFLAVRDLQGRLPGEREDYCAYLMALLSEERYTTKKAPSQLGHCLLCEQHSLLYPNALKGAGFNLTNTDRAGAFAGLKAQEAWKRQGFCGVCADLLTVYRNRMMPSFLTRLAGEEALVLPTLRGEEHLRRDFFDEFQGWLDHTQEGVQETESSMVEWLQEEKALLSITLLWGELRGQYVDEICGYLSQVMPSRLRQLSEHNQRANKWSHPCFPSQKHPLARWSLMYTPLALVLRLEGRTKAQRNVDKSRHGILKRSLLTALLHHRQADALFEELQHELYTALLCLAQKAWNDPNKEQVTNSLLNEHTYSSPKASLTLASWVRQSAQVLHYLRTTGVFPMITPDDVFVPDNERLQPFFGPESGIDSPEKAFAFMVGVLYGQLLLEQRRRQVNVAANALTWVKRYQIESWELRDLWVKTVSKLSEYDLVDSRSWSEMKDQKVPKDERYAKQLIHELNEEMGRLGTTLGEHIEMERMTTNYFLLLGQSLARSIRYNKKEATPAQQTQTEGE